MPRQTPRLARPLRQRPALHWAAASALACMLATSAAAAVVDAASLPNGTLMGSDNFQGLSFGSGAANWYAFSYPTSGPVFVLGSGSAGQQSGAYQFIRATEAFQINSIRMAWVGGNDTVDGWFDLYNDSTRVFSGDKGLKSESFYDVNLAFTVGTTARTVDVTPLASTSSAVSPSYNRVVLVFRQANNPPNYAAIQSFDIQALNPTSMALGSPVVAVPEPSSVALLMAGLGTVGWVTRRRRHMG